VLSLFAPAFRTPDLRKKLLFTGAMIVLFRFGSNLPAPGISERSVSYCSRLSSSGGVFAVLNLLSGNSLLHLTVFAIGILPAVRDGVRAGGQDRRGVPGQRLRPGVSPSLLRAALVLLDSREDAEDVLQVTMLRTYRRWEQARQAPQAYARAVLVNACRERWRHRGRHPEISQDVDELANVVSFAEVVDRRPAVPSPRGR
jgi:hypothetical protein